MSDHHADGAFNFFRRRTEHRTIDSCASNCAMHNMIDLVCLEAEHFCKTAANLIDCNHSAQSCCSVKSCNICSCNSDGIKIIMAELACCVPERRVETKVGSVGIPFTNCRTVCNNRLFGGDCLRRTENARARFLSWISQRFFTQQSWRVGSKCQRRCAAKNAVGVKENRSRLDNCCGIAALHEVDCVLSDAECLVGIPWKFCCAHGVLAL